MHRPACADIFSLNNFLNDTGVDVDTCVRVGIVHMTGQRIWKNDDLAGEKDESLKTTVDFETIGSQNIILNIVQLELC